MGRAAFVFSTIAFFLGACAAGPAPVGQKETQPALTESMFVTSDGLELPLRIWSPSEGEVKAAVVALHGFNDHSKAFGNVPDAPGVGPYLSQRGIAVYAYDQRGFGAGPQPGRWAGADRMVKDLRDMIALVRDAHPDVPIHVLGVSMGGAVTLAALASDDPPHVASAILAAPAVWGRATMPWAYRAGLWIGKTFLPGMKPSGRGLGRQASDNIEMLRENARDPLFIKETRIDTIAGLTDLMDRALMAPSNVHTPVLYLYGTNDQIIPADPTRAALSLFPDTTPVTLAVYDTGWHMLLRDLNSETVLKDVASHILTPERPLPSEADQSAEEAIAALP